MNEVGTFSDFLKSNDQKCNLILNRVCWICLLVTPFLGICQLLGIFSDIKLIPCIIVFSISLVTAVLHTLLYKKIPSSWATIIVGLVGNELAIISMYYLKINVHLTWFWVPLASIFFCRKKMYIHTTIAAYLIMAATLLVSMNYRATTVVGFTPITWFMDELGGNTIEFFFMFVVGYVVNRLISSQLKIIYGDKIELAANTRKTFVDPLTEMWNQTYLIEKFNYCLSDKAKTSSLVCISIDNFSIFSEEFGHSEANRAIKAVAKTIEITLLGYDEVMAFRLEGENFCILFNSISNTINYPALLENIRNTYLTRTYRDDTLSEVTLCMGSTIINKEKDTLSTAYARAEKNPIN